MLIALCAGGALLLGTGCSGDDPVETIPSASATIDAAGGTLNGPDGVVLTIPPGALDAPTTIRIARTAVGAPEAAPDGHTASSPIYEITPHGLTFNLPVTISVPSAPAVGEDVLGAFTAGPNEPWRALVSDMTDGRLSWDTLSFSWFVAAICAPNDPDDPYQCIWPRVAPVLTATPSTAATQAIDGLNLKAWNVTQAATLRMALSVSAAADCLRSPRVTVRPRLPSSAGAVYGDPVFDQEVTLVADPANARYARQTVNWDFSVSSEDNGSLWFAVQFSCERLHTARRQSITGYAIVNVDAPAATPLPTFVAHPLDASVVAPQSATFTITAVGDPAPTVRWQRSDDDGGTWADIAGATAAAYNTPPTTMADDGSQYRAVATNIGGSTTSSAARLTVTAPLGGTWQAPQTVAGVGANFDPSTGFDASGRALAVWNAVPTGSTVARTYFSTSAATAAWSAPLTIDGAFSNGYEARIAVAPDGRAVAVWGYKSGSQYHLAASHFDGSAWAAPARVDSGTPYNADKHSVAIDASGRAVVTWVQFDGARYGVYASVSAGGAWSAPTIVDRGLDSGLASLSLNAQGQGYVLFTETSDTVVATPIDLAVGFGTPQEVRPKGRSVGPTRIAVDDGGGAIAVWVDGTVDGDKLRYSRYAAGSGWAVPSDLAVDVGWPWDRDLALAGAGTGGVIVAWSQYDTQGDQVVLSRSFTPGAGWGTIDRLSTATLARDYAENPRVAINRTGRAAVTWLQYDAPGGIYQVWGRVYDGAWLGAQRLPNSGNTVDSSAAHALAISGDNAALSIWAEQPSQGADQPLVSAVWD